MNSCLAVYSLRAFQESRVRISGDREGSEGSSRRDDKLIGDDGLKARERRGQG